MELKIDKKLFYLDKEEYITLHNFIRERNAIILKDSFSSLVPLLEMFKSLENEK